MPNHRSIVKGFITFLLCIVMSACTVLTPPEPFPLPSTITPQITEKVTAEIRTPTVFTATVKPSAIPLPSQTATIRRPTKTVDPQSMLTEQAHILKATQIAAFPTVCDKFSLETTLLSPNSNWLAISCDNPSDENLEINSKTGKQWVLHFKDYLAEKFTRDGIPLGRLFPEHWTNDNEYLYFSSYIAYDGGGACFYGFGAQGLYRINMNTGVVSGILPPKTSLGGYLIAFSPVGGKLAYNSGDPMILDLRTGEITAIDDAYGVVGDMTWSPDGSQLAYATCGTADGQTINNSTVEIFSLETRKSITILDLEMTRLNIEFWDINQHLKIVASDIQTGKYNYLFFDTSSERFITPTP